MFRPNGYFVKPYPFKILPFRLTDLRLLHAVILTSKTLPKSSHCSFSLYWTPEAFYSLFQFVATAPSLVYQPHLQTLTIDLFPFLFLLLLLLAPSPSETSNQSALQPAPLSGFPPQLSVSLDSFTPRKSCTLSSAFIQTLLHLLLSLCQILHNRDLIFH